MERNNRVATAVRRALIMSALTTAGVAAPALAQDNLGEIVVTGSRIKSANLETTTPVTQITSADVVTQGVNRIEDLVNQLPQAFAAQNVTVSNGSNGTATLNLRGLGSPRTLVLVDGRRLPYGSVSNSAANINSIPTQMIERVEVLTGGASAVYGSDAVAGVVNFILKKDFEGVEVTSQYNFYWHENDFSGPGLTKLRDTIAARAATNPAQFALPDSTVTDGEGKQIGVMMGVNSGDGRGNITAYASVFDSDAILEADRDYSACSLNPNPTTSFTCGGSSTAAGGRFTDFSTYNFTADTATNFRNFSNALDQYNFGPLNYFQRPERRFDLGATGHYEFGEHADVYTQLGFNDYESIAQIAPGGIFIGDTSTINCGNPLLPQGSLLAIGCTPANVAANANVPMYIGRRNVEGGGRQQQFAFSGFRGVVGLRGAINEAWDYDVSAQYSTGGGANVTANYFQKDRIVKALDVVDVGGVPTCQSVVDGTDLNCVPYNPFVPGGVTAAQLNYLQVRGIQDGRLTQEIYNGVINGDLGNYGWKTPWASDGIQVVFGAEYRRDTLSNKVDALQEQNQLSGAGGATIGIAGSTKVTDLFMEGRVPIAQDVKGAESLSFDTAYRYSDYGSGTTTDTYKFGLEWAPISDVRFRASYQRAVRAANIVELFTAQGFNLFDAPGDPCGAALQALPNPAASQAECLATGVPAAQFGSAALDSPAGQYQFLQGGNPNLVPESSDTNSFGIIFTPRFAPGMSLSADWFNIKIKDTISTFGAQSTLDACYVNNDPAACSRIHRTAGLGQLWLGDGNVVDTNINIGSLEAEGIDVNFAYTGVEIGRFGSLNFSLVGTYFDKLVTEPGPGIGKYDCVGHFSAQCLQPTNEWRHMARVSWVTPWDVDLSLGWRFYGSVVGIIGTDQNGVVEMPSNQIDRKIPDESYFDLSANWAVTEKASVTLGINNILDDNPSISGSVGTTGNGNTYPQTYDALGRYVFLRATLNF
jgi:outer membrane receptor protein involved in Fe transport